MLSSHYGQVFVFPVKPFYKAGLRGTSFQHVRHFRGFAASAYSFAHISAVEVGYWIINPDAGKRLNGGRVNDRVGSSFVDEMFEGVLPIH